MDMVFHTADDDGRAIELFGDAAEIKSAARRGWIVAQERTTVLLEKPDVGVSKQPT